MNDSSYINWKISVIEAIFYNDIRIEISDDAPKGFLTKAHEVNVNWTPKMYYLIHPDDLEAIRKQYPKQIPIQIQVDSD